MKCGAQIVESMKEGWHENKQIYTLHIFYFVKLFLLL